jgi:NAD(P)-dependent dehydrogenase (short-subunit alcohol dehydrogenase family)
MDKREQKHRVLITGGTGSVGRELVKVFSLNGNEVYFQYNQNLTVANELSSATGAKAVQIDLSKEINLPINEFNIVINNAAINISNVISDQIKLEDFDLTLSINLRAPFQIIKECLPFMIGNKWGRIINISSIYGLRGIDWNMPYNVSKHALSGLTKSIAKDYGAFGITCNEICPGPLDSDMMRRIGTEEGASKGQTVEEYLHEYAQQIPTKRLGSPIEVAKLALFIASVDAGYLNGASIPLDGGWIA